MTPQNTVGYDRSSRRVPHLFSLPLVVLLFLALSGSREANAGADATASPGTLRIICFGAHPDDCELQIGGTAALWAKRGHKVKFVSVTNGDIGHWQEAGAPLARRRRAEVEKADSLLGAATEILDIHDGELLPTLENRRTLTRLIREWKADVVLSHRPNDYHPDHRYTGVLVQDAAYMVTVPSFCPDSPVLSNNPAFFYYSDRFQKPNPFKPDVVVDISPVMERKLDALAIMVSQFAEGGANGYAGLMPSDEAGQQRRHREVRESMTRRNQSLADRFRNQLVEQYGAEKGPKVKFAEAFELCEYGRQPNQEEIRRMFPVSE